MSFFKLFFGLFMVSTLAWAQVIDPNNLSPEQSAELQRQLQEYQKEQQQQFQQFQEQKNTDGGDNPTTLPYVPPAPITPPKAGQFTQNPTTSFNSKELEKKVAVRVKDPFMLPNDLFLKIKKKLGDVQGEGYVDESVEPQVRWALKHYKLVAIIWNVKKPKAMITDRKGDIHMFYIDDRIGNNEGVIASIQNGEVVIIEKGAEIKLKIK